MKKLLVVGVIVLFLGLAVAPSINANVSKESELVEITTEICGLGGGKHTVQLTQEEAEEVEQLFENIRLQLNESTSREEAKEIFNKAIVELDKYGLLGGLSVKQAQRLITGMFQTQRFFNRMFPRTLDENENKFCLIAGMTSDTHFEGIGALFFEKLNDIFWAYGLIGYSIFEIFAILNPIPFYYRINLGHEYFVFEGESEYYYSYGWIFTIGSNGIKIYKRKMEGDLPIQGSFLYLGGGLSHIGYFPGVVGFTGIKIDSFLYLGYAHWVKIKECK